MRAHIFIGALILIAVVVNFIVLSQLPEQIASHWNSQGEVDDYLPKFWGVMLFPIVSIVLWILLTFLPRLEPYRKNFESFQVQYQVFMVVLIAFLFYIHVGSLLFNLGYTFNMTYYVVPAVALLMFWIGIILPQTKRNFFMGIRTPWTLTSDLAWRKTHELGGKIFKVFGVLMLVSLLMPQYAFMVLIGLLIVSIVVLMLYSYVIYSSDMSRSTK